MKRFVISYETIKNNITAQIDAATLPEAILIFMQNHSDKFIKIQYVMFLDDETKEIKREYFNIRNIKSE